MKRNTRISLLCNADSAPTAVGHKSVVKRLCAGAFAALTLTLAGCNDDDIKREYTLNATMEQLQDASNTKVRLYNEQWTYWEYNDNITVRGDQSVKQDLGWLVGSSTDYEDYNGVFATQLEEIEGNTSTYFLALFPANDNHVIANNNNSSNKCFTGTTIYLEKTQHYRDDSSYARDVLPMVAWYGGRAWGDNPDTEDPNPPRLDFHSLAGLVRLQLLNGTNSTKHISSITLTSLAGSGGYTAKRLHGSFPIQNLYVFNASLGDSAYTSGDENTLTLDMSQAEGGSLVFAPNDLKSFYIVLPAFHGMDTSSCYRLQMTVNTTEGDAFSKTFSVRTRRNGITYLRAINVTNFSSGPSNNPTLVGNGTSTRPFKIYTLDDLVYIRSCFANPAGDGFVYVNGQKVTANTWFRIMRSDINLSPSVWNEGGISNFTGHMTYYANVSNYHDTTALTGITNNSTKPLFESIGANGVVDGLAIRCDSTITIGGNYSPLCATNNGKIVNCHTGKQAAGRSPYIGSATSFSGICALNNGIIEGCGCSYQGQTSTGAKFSGICNINNGTIRGCYAASPMEVTGPTTAAGVCHDNNGTVEDCYFAARINNGTRWAGIVYNNNSGHTVQHCYFGDGSMLFADTVGGIVAVNNGTIDYCWGNGNLRGDKVGGIAATVGSNGTITNCYINDSAYYFTIRSTGTRHMGGGLAAEVMSGGSIRNSYVVMRNIMQPAGSVFGAVVGYIRTGGTINNCYGLMDSTTVTPRFYGTSQSDALGSVFLHCHLVSGTQAGVNRIYAKNSTDGELNDLDELLNDLNTNRGTYVEWERSNSGNNTTPQLKAYTRPTSKYFRPAKHRR